MNRPVVESVADTAFMVARYRAVETERADALFRDPLAAKVAGEEGRRMVDSLGRHGRAGAWSLAIRTVIIDELVEHAVSRGADVVLSLGAGLDTRPYRLDLPGVRWIEVDVPRVIDVKEARLAGETPRCAVERVKLDLADLEPRRRLFAEISARARAICVLTEGVVPYLDPAAVGVLANDLAKTPHVATWIVDYFSPEVLRYRRRVQARLANAPFKFKPDDWFGFFAEHGWRPREERWLVEEGKRLGRGLPIARPLFALLALRSAFASSERRERMRRSIGYVVLEPAS
mgnify:CR=1 FL=1